MVRKSNKNLQFCWGFMRDSICSCALDSIAECLEEARLEDPHGKCRSIYIGTYKEYDPEKYIDESIVDTIIEQIREEGAYYEEAEEWFDEIGQKEKEELSDLLDPLFRKWMKEKGCNPFFGDVDNVIEYNLKTGEPNTRGNIDKKFSFPKK